MLARNNRFHGHKSVSRVRGKRLALPGFKVFYAFNPKRQDFRMAVVVAKKVSKSAVVRNRIRRRLYEAVRMDGGLNSLPVDTVFVVHDPGLATMPAEHLKLQVAQACETIASSRR